LSKNRQNKKITVQLFTINATNPGANPTIAIYNAVVVKIYNATSSLACFESKSIFFQLKRLSMYPTTTPAL
jgi:hypothetical protein